MTKVELEQQEVEMVLNQLTTMPMGKVENMVFFFREKLQAARDADEKKPKPKRRSLIQNKNKEKKEE
jgi:hypothetical protein